MSDYQPLNTGEPEYFIYCIQDALYRSRDMRRPVWVYQEIDGECAGQWQIAPFAPILPSLKVEPDGSITQNINTPKGNKYGISFEWRKSYRKEWLDIDELETSCNICYRKVVQVFNQDSFRPIHLQNKEVFKQYFQSQLLQKMRESGCIHQVRPEKAEEENNAHR